MFIEAVGINPTAARFSGINAQNITSGVYMFSGFCAGLSGLIVCSTVMSADGNNAGNLLRAGRHPGGRARAAPRSTAASSTCWAA